MEGIRTNRANGFKGKYCTSCNSVWEMPTADQSGIEVKYPDFPSFGLERQYCSGCKGTSPGDTDTSLTLAQKAVIKHQELCIKHVKKQSK